MLERIENRRRQRHETHEGDIGEHEARERNREIEGLPVLAHPACNRPDEKGRTEYAQDACRQHRRTEDREDVVDEGRAALGTFTLAHVGEHRHERLLESPFGKEPSKHVGKSKRDVERVGFRGCTEVAGDQHVSDHPGDARHQGEAGNRCGGLDERHSKLENFGRSGFVAPFEIWYS